jgi:hypothetical protein
MYPEVEEYFRIDRDARHKREEAHAEADYIYTKAMRDVQYAWEAEHPAEVWDAYGQQQRGGVLYEDYQVRQRANRAASGVYEEAVSGRDELLRGSQHEEVKWIALNALERERGYSEIILRNLPVETPEALWELKRTHGMCQVFDQLFASAEADGVFTKGVKPLGARELAALRNKIERNYGSRYAAQFNEDLNAFVRRIRNLATDQLEQAKAEWQKLDEAQAEQHARTVAHNRSEGAKRAAETRRRNAEIQAQVEREEQEWERQVASEAAHAPADLYEVARDFRQLAQQEASA